MMSVASTDFPDVIAGRIRAANREIARRWLDQLKALLPVGPNEIFPSDQILDHVPALVQEIADYVGHASSEAVVSNTAVLSKARELGDLRFEQRASVHQLLREYRILATVLSSFVYEQLQSHESLTNAADGVVVINRLNEAVFVLLQTTVDTFVNRYTTQIEEQTTRLESFNRMVSHELRQPLGSVRQAVELLRGPEGADAEKRDHFVEVADRNVKRLAQLLGMLGAVVQSNHDNPQLQSVDVAKVVANVFHQLRDAAEAKNVSLRSDVGSVALTTDLSRLELILVNLVANSIKYSDPAKTDSFVEVSLVEDASGCALSVRDNGLGIPASEQSMIFRRFHRAHADRDAELGNDGIGLGLVIAADCAKGLKASLTFESTPGAGTTFTLTLPRA